LICSTLKSTKPTLKDLYEFKSCAHFVANYITYEPLDPPYEPPKMIPSPTFTLGVQRGNCFDMAIVLCSLLHGAGYDAYVVSGYAMKVTTLMDESATVVDPETFIKKYQPIEALFNLKTDMVDKHKESIIDRKYKLRNGKHLESSFLEKQAERQAKAQEEMDANRKNSSSESTQVSHGIHFHEIGCRRGR
jgi:hypothetical protein